MRRTKQKECSLSGNFVHSPPSIAKGASSLSVLILSRNRPDILQETLASLILNAANVENLIEQSGRLSIHVGIDEDDGETRSVMSNWPLVKWRVGSRPTTIGEGYNHLWRETKANFYLVWSDDKIIETQGWDEILLGGMGEGFMGYIPDPDHSRGAVTQYALPGVWAAQAGYVAVEWFPYWFIDTWWDHVAAMIGNKRALPISMRQNPKAPGTTGMRDLSFWARFFQETEEERVSLASKIRNMIFAADDERRRLSLAQQEHWRKVTAGNMINLELAEEIEAVKSHGAPSDRYEMAKARACAFLQAKDQGAGEQHVLGRTSS